MTSQKTLLSLLSQQESLDPAHLQTSANGRAGLLGAKLEMIGEDDTVESYDLYDPYEDDQSEHGDMDFLEVELVRSKFRNFSFTPFFLPCFFCFSLNS